MKDSLIHRLQGSIGTSLKLSGADLALAARRLQLFQQVCKHHSRIKAAGGPVQCEDCGLMVPDEDKQRRAALVRDLRNRSTEAED